LTDVTYKYVPLTSSPSISPATSDTLTSAIPVVVMMDETTQQEILVLTPFLLIFGAIGVVMFLASRSNRLPLPLITPAVSIPHGAAKVVTTPPQSHEDNKIKQMEENSSPSLSPSSSSLSLSSLGNDGDDIFVQHGLQSIPDDKTTQRFVTNQNSHSWESERSPIRHNKEEEIPQEIL
jgi:hypothetical protein